MARPGVLQPQQVVGERHVEPARTFGDLERGEPVHVDLRRDLLHRARDVDVVVAVEVGMDAALQAHLGRAALDGFDHPPLHLLHLEQVRLAAQVERERTLRERAEPALERAHVRVVDVAVADERDLVADDLAAELVGDLGDPHDLGPARAEQRDDLVDADLFAGEHAVEHFADRGRRRGAGASGGEQRAAASRSSRPGDHAPSRARPSESEATSTGVRTSGSSHVVGIAHELGIDREARREDMIRPSIRPRRIQ